MQCNRLHCSVHVHTARQFQSYAISLSLCVCLSLPLSLLPFCSSSLSLSRFFQASYFSSSLLRPCSAAAYACMPLHRFVYFIWSFVIVFWTPFNTIMTIAALSICIQCVCVCVRASAHTCVRACVCSCVCGLFGFVCFQFCLWFYFPLLDQYSLFLCL